MNATFSGAKPVGRIATIGFGLVVMVALLVLLPPRAAHAITLTVTNTQDPGNGTCDASCTLREAINVSNNLSTTDTINFDIPDDPGIPGLEVKTISPTSALPIITDTVTIDGYTQDGAVANSATTNSNNAVLKIELDGTGTNVNTSGLAVSGADAGGTTIKGLVINRFGNNGVFISGAPGAIIEGNFIGTNADGDADLGNSGAGVILLSPDNLVGGPANAAQNIISGNDGSGVAVGGSGATGNTISNNHIGTDADAGEDLGNFASGVRVTAPGVTIGGSSADGTLNIISGNNQHGVEILGLDASGTKVLGNLIGVNLNGNGFSNIGNTQDGVLVNNSSEVEIGGTGDGQGNTISDNASHGVEILNSSSTNNKVLGNRIGTNANGSSAFGNVGTGIRIFDTPGNFVGGTSAGAKNVISGNRLDGVFIGGANATDNKVEGNFVGTDTNGTGDLGNGFDGVRVEAPNTIVGGTEAGARNVISGNDSDGVSMLGTGASGNTVQGNLIGTKADGTTALGNVVSGVRVGDALNNTIGGTTAAAANTISGNANDGVIVLGASATGNRILRNSIFDNGAPDGLGIDLNNDGVTANDPKDPDTGPNLLQNFPDLASATVPSGGQVTITGNLNSTPSTLIKKKKKKKKKKRRNVFIPKVYTVQFFSNPAPNFPTGFGEGERFIGEATVVTNLSGNAPINLTFIPEQTVSAGEFVAATATDSGGNTSEFSAARVVQ